MSLKDADPKIDPAAYLTVVDQVFAKGNLFTGRTMAEFFGLTQQNMWNLVFKVGLTAKNARKLADGFQNWALTLLEKAGQMRLLADQLESGELAPMEKKPWGERQRSPGIPPRRGRGPNRKKDLPVDESEPIEVAEAGSPIATEEAEAPASATPERAEDEPAPETESESLESDDTDVAEEPAPIFNSRAFRHFEFLSSHRQR